MEGKPVAFTVKEWHRLQSLFLSNALDDLKECHIILAAWNHRIPMVAVNCCELVVASLIGSKLELPEEFAYMKLDNMRRQYAIAVVRFVNYINELGQTGIQGARVLTMRESVAKFGVAPWLVQLRHQATHNELPSLEELHRGLEYSRKWLWDHFWTRPVREAMIISSNEQEQAQEAEYTGRSASSRRTTRLMSMMVQYVEWRAQNVSFNIATSLVNSRPSILIDVENSLLQEPHELLSLVVSDGFFILNTEQLAPFKDFDPYSGVIPQRFQLFWDPIVTMCFENHTMHFFIVEMMERLRDSSTCATSRAQLITWSKLFLEGALDANIFSTRDWSLILSSMVALPGCFSRQLLKRVLDQVPELESKRIGQVHRIMDISMHDEDGNLLEDSMTVRTIDDLKKAIDQDVNHRRSALVEGGVWERNSELDWRMTPLGMVPGQSFSNFSLIIDDSLLAEWNIEPSGHHSWNDLYNGDKAARLEMEITMVDDDDRDGEEGEEEMERRINGEQPPKKKKKKSLVTKKGTSSKQNEEEEMITIDSDDERTPCEDSFVESMKRRKKNKGGGKKLKKMKVIDPIDTDPSAFNASLALLKKYSSETPETSGSGK